MKNFYPEPVPFTRSVYTPGKQLILANNLLYIIYFKIDWNKQIDQKMTMNMGITTFT